MRIDIAFRWVELGKLKVVKGVSSTKYLLVGESTA